MEFDDLPADWIPILKAAVLVVSSYILGTLALDTIRTNVAFRRMIRAYHAETEIVPNVYAHRDNTATSGTADNASGRDNSDY